MYMLSGFLPSGSCGKSGDQTKLKKKLSKQAHKSIEFPPPQDTDFKTHLFLQQEVVQFEGLNIEKIGVYFFLQCMCSSMDNDDQMLPHIFNTNGNVSYDKVA